MLIIVIDVVQRLNTKRHTGRLCEPLCKNAPSQPYPFHPDRARCRLGLLHERLCILFFREKLLTGPWKPGQMLVMAT